MTPTADTAASPDARFVEMRPDATRRVSADALEVPASVVRGTLIALRVTARSPS